MMKTSRIVLWILCLALVASCKKNGNTGDDVPENGFRAKIVQPDQGNAKGERTHINPNWTTQTETSVFWTENDLIKIANQGGNGNTLTFQLTEGENTTSGTFYTGEQNGGFFEPDYMAAYPAANAEGTATTISGSTATFTMLSTQSYKANTFDEGAMPMVASSSTQTLDFYNVFGGLCFPFKGGLTVTSIKLTSKDESDKLWGVFTADCSSSDPVPTHVGGGDNTITLDCGTGVFCGGSNGKDFYFMLPPGTLESGFTVTVYNGTSVLYEESVDWSDAPVTGFIPRSVVKKVGQGLEMIQVTTNSPTYITHSSAFTGGKRSGAMPTDCGILYALADDLSNRSAYEDFMADADANLRIGNDNVNRIGGLLTGTSFTTLDMTGLTENTVYVVRAYALNSTGTAFYGEPIPFATRKDYANDYGGMIPSRFSVSPTKQINFSMGNLQFNAALGSHERADGTTSHGTWRFAEYQFEYVGNATDGLVYTGGMFPPNINVGNKCNNNLIAEDYAGWIDNFGWGTSGCNHGAVSYQPWATNRVEYEYLAYGQNTANLYDGNGYADWGVYNAISNGGNQPGLWYTLGHNATDLSASPWNYLLYERAASTVNGVANARWFLVGVSFRNNLRQAAQILLPDNFSWPHTYVNSYPEIINGYYNVAVNQDARCNNSRNLRWTEAEWSLLEMQGAVIIPHVGFRQGASFYNTSSYYNSSTSGIGSSSPNCYRIQPRSQAGIVVLGVKCGGAGVRLVRDAN